MIRILWLALVTALVAGCGSGGGATVTAVDPRSEPGTAIVDLSTETESAVKVIYGVEFVLHLPAGVTVLAEPDGKVREGVLQPTDSGAFAGARYVPATDTAPAFVKVNIADAGGFLVGNLATLRCIVSPGAAISALRFSPDDCSAWDADIAKIPGVTWHFAVRTL